MTYGLVIHSFIKCLLSTHCVLGVVLEQWFSIRGDFCPLLDPRDIWKHLETVLIVITRVDGTAYNEYRSGLLLNILQCTGQATPMTKIILHKISIVLKLRNPVLDVGEWEKVPVSLEFMI